MNEGQKLLGDYQLLHTTVTEMTQKMEFLRSQVQKFGYELDGNVSRQNRKSLHVENDFALDLEDLCSLASDAPYLIYLMYFYYSDLSLSEIMQKVKDIRGYTPQVNYRNFFKMASTGYYEFDGASNIAKTIEACEFKYWLTTVKREIKDDFRNHLFDNGYSYLSDKQIYNTDKKLFLKFLQKKINKIRAEVREIDANHSYKNYADIWRFVLNGDFDEKIKSNIKRI